MPNEWALAWLVVLYVACHALRKLMDIVMEIFYRKVPDSECVLLFLLLCFWVTD